MPKLNKRQLLIAANHDLYDRLERTLPDAGEDDEKAENAFMEAEIVIDTYLEGVAAQSAQLPAGPDLALACAHVLVATQALTQEDMATLTRLNAPALGVPLYEVAPQVADMQRRALAALETMATDSAERPQDSDSVF